MIDCLTYFEQILDIWNFGSNKHFIGIAADLANRSIKDPGDYFIALAISRNLVNVGFD